jgi:hypothetical protein
MGTVGYHNFGQIGWLDSFHMACMILTGMRPVLEMKSNAAKLFSSSYSLFDYHSSFFCTNCPSAITHFARRGRGE